MNLEGFQFKDLNKNGQLDIYEDWRANVVDRAKDLATKMTVDQIAGLMLYSRHQAVPAQEAGMFAGTYGNKPFSESGAKASDLSDQQIAFLTNDNLRHVLLTSVQNPEVAATWNNNVQKLVEGIGVGIPANNSSDPRHGANKDAEYNAGSGGTISQWPEELGLAATFDPSITRQFGMIASLAEFRTLLDQLDDQPYPLEVAEKPRGRTSHGRPPTLPDGWLNDPDEMIHLDAEDMFSGG
mgnify:CR=1 FL=1